MTVEENGDFVENQPSENSADEMRQQLLVDSLDDIRDFDEESENIAEFDKNS